LAFALPLNVEAMERATDTTGMLLSTFGIVALIVFLTPLNRIYDAFSAIKLITIGLSCIGIGMVMLGIYANFYVNFFVMFICVFDAFSALKLITLGLFCIGIGMVMLGLYANFYVNFFAMIIYGFGFAFIFPSMNKVIADASSKVDRGKAYGVFYAFFSFGVVI